MVLKLKIWAIFVITFFLTNTFFSIPQADLQSLRQQDQSTKIAGVSGGGKLSPLKSANSIPAASSASVVATSTPNKLPVRATTSLPVTPPPTSSSARLVQQGSLDASMLSVQANIPEMDEGGSSTSSGVRSPSFYGFQ